jgi:hypothetical protein
VYKINEDKVGNFWKIRVVMKATLLSLSHYSPLYLLASTVAVDLLLAIAEYQITSYPKHYPKCWIFSNVMVNIALVLLVFLPTFILSLILVTAIILSVIVMEGIMHYQERKANIETEEVTDSEGKNIWDVNYSN